MTTVSDKVTINSPNHHHKLIGGLWNSFLAKTHVDFNLISSGRLIRTHRLLLDLFLSSDKLVAAVQRDQNDDCSVLESLLEFLYTGRLVVTRDRLNDLLVLATNSDFSLLVDALQNEKETNCSEKSEAHKPTRDNLPRIDKFARIKPCYVKLERLPNLVRRKIVTKRRTRRKAIPESVTVISEPKNEHCKVLNTTIDKIGISNPHSLENSQAQNPDKLEPAQIMIESGDLDHPETTGIRVSNVRSLRSTANVQADSFDSNQPLIGANNDSANQSMEENIPTVQTHWKDVSNLKQAADSVDQQLKAFLTAVSSEFDKLFAEIPIIGDLDHTDSTSQFEKPDKSSTMANPSIIMLSRQILPPMPPIPNRRQISILTTKQHKHHNCPMCRESFCKIADLNRHLLIHTDEMPYKCTLFSRPTYNQSDNVKASSVLHLGDKQYKCILCSHACQIACTLREHLLYHTGQRPFICNSCSKNDQTKKANETFKCHVCSMTFNQDFKLQYHLRIHGDVGPVDLNADSVLKKLLNS